MPWRPVHTAVQVELNQPHSLVLVATPAPTLPAAGFVVGWWIQAAQELQIAELAVHPEHRSKGVGRMLLVELMRSSG